MSEKTPVEAVRWFPEKPASAFPDWLWDVLSMFPEWLDLTDSSLHFRTYEGSVRIEVGDWIIRGERGQLIPCKPDIFELYYEAMHDTTAPPADAKEDATP